MNNPTEDIPLKFFGDMDHVEQSVFLSRLIQLARVVPNACDSPSCKSDLCVIMRELREKYPEVFR